MTFNGTDLLELEPDERACEGLFLAFQYPVEIPGVNNAYLLKAALNARRRHLGMDEIDAFEFLKLAREKPSIRAAVRADVLAELLPVLCVLHCHVEHAP